MRIKLSGRAELVEALEVAFRNTPGAMVDGSVKRREGANLKFDLKQWADVVGFLKDVAELAAVLWSGYEFLRKQYVEKTGGEPPVETVECVTTSDRVHVTLKPGISVDEVKSQLTKLAPTKKP